MKEEWTIYKIVFPNGKNYVGLTKDLYNRISGHKRDATKKVHRPVYHAINHFGWDSIRFENIETRISTLEKANELEMKYIKELNSHVDNGNGYNATPGGDGTLGKKLSPERIEKFIEESKARWRDPEYREMMLKNANDRKGNYSDESKQKMSKSAKARIARDGHTWVGRKHSEESKEKMSGPRSSINYRKAQLKRARKIYCSELEVVFLSLGDCAEFFNVRKSTLWQGLRNPNTRKYKSLSYYN